MKLFSVGTKFSAASYQKSVIMTPNEMGHRICYSHITMLHFLCLSMKCSYSMRSQTLKL